jgi:hypothetical protein
LVKRPPVYEDDIEKYINPIENKETSTFAKELELGYDEC